MASRKTLNRRPRPQRATSNVFAMFDQAQIQVSFYVFFFANLCNNIYGLAVSLFAYLFASVYLLFSSRKCSPKPNFALPDLDSRLLVIVTIYI